MVANAVVDVYERASALYDRERGRSLQERPWLDRFLAHVPAGGTILDVGCGMGEPIGRYCLERGFRIVGVDAAPSMIELCRARFPESEWLVLDMRAMWLSRRFAGILAWDSFFHLAVDDQRAMFHRFASHAADGAPLMFTSGSCQGEAIGAFGGFPLYHASLDAEEYEHLLSVHGFEVRAHRADDPECGGHTVWLATFGRAGGASVPAAAGRPRGG